MANALKNLKGLLLYFVFLMAIEGFGIYYFRMHLLELFTDDPSVLQMGHSLFWTQIIWMLTDLWLASLAGILRGIGKQ